MMTTLDFTVSLANVANFDRMTPEAQAVLSSADSVTSHGFQSLVGHVGRKAVWEAGAHFCDLTQTWHLESLGNGAMVPVWSEA